MPFKQTRKRSLYLRGILFFLALLPVVGLSGCGGGDVTVKMTAKVASGGRIYSGSSIQRYRCRESLPIMSATGRCGIYGEAVVVHVPGRGHLFLVFDQPGKRSQTEMVLSVLGGGTNYPFEARQDDLETNWSLDYDQMPLMVRFRDPADPVSVEAVDAANLSATMGPGVSLVSVEMQASSEPVTYGEVRKAIPWIADPNFSFYKMGEGNPLAESFATSTFVSGG